MLAVGEWKLQLASLELCLCCPDDTFNQGKQYQPFPAQYLLLRPLSCSRSLLMPHVIKTSSPHLLPCCAYRQLPFDRMPCCADTPCAASHLVAATV